MQRAREAADADQAQPRCAVSHRASAQNHRFSPATAAAQCTLGPHSTYTVQLSGSAAWSPWRSVNHLSDVMQLAVCGAAGWRPVNTAAQQLCVCRRHDGKAVRALQYHHEQYRGTPVHLRGLAASRVSLSHRTPQIGRQRGLLALAAANSEAAAVGCRRLIGVHKEQHVVGLVAPQLGDGRRTLAKLLHTARGRS